MFKRSTHYASQRMYFVNVRFCVKVTPRSSSSVHVLGSIVYFSLWIKVMNPCLILVYDEIGICQILLRNFDGFKSPLREKSV